MGRPYSTDLRERVLRACEVGEESQAAIARRFEISESAVGSWLRQLRRDGRREPKPQRPDREVLAEGAQRPRGQHIGVLLRVPVVIEQLLSMTVGLTDVWLAGHLGAQSADATAAVGSISYFLWLIGLVTGTINAGSTAIIARAMGARHKSLANKVCGQSVAAAMLLGIALAALLWLFASRQRREARKYEGLRTLR